MYFKCDIICCSNSPILQHRSLASVAVAATSQHQLRRSNISGLLTRKNDVNIFLYVVVYIPFSFSRCNKEVKFFMTCSSENAENRTFNAPNSSKTESPI